MRRSLGIVSAIGVPAMSTDSVAQQKVVTLKYTNFSPAPHANSIIADRWCREVKKRTDGATRWVAPVKPILDDYVKNAKG